MKFTAAALGVQISDNTCICHKLNNLVKKMLSDYFEDVCLTDWRNFIKRLNKSHPFREAWDRCCLLTFEEKIILQLDTPTRLFFIFFLRLFLFFKIKLLLINFNQVVEYNRNDGKGSQI